MDTGTVVVSIVFITVMLLMFVSLILCVMWQDR